MDVEVMDYIAALKRGDLEQAMHISFDCIQCGFKGQGSRTLADLQAAQASGTAGRTSEHPAV